MAIDSSDDDRIVERVTYIDEQPPDRWGRVASILAGVIGLLIVTAVSAFLYLYLSGVVNPPAPRTALEARLEVIETALQTNPKNGKIWADYIVVQTNLGLLTEAKETWQEAQKELAKLPDEMIQADLAWAQSLMLQTQPEAALKQAELVIKNDPAAVQALGKKNPSMLEMGLTRTGMLAPAYVVKGNSLVALERWEEAAEAYSAAITEDPRAADLLVLRAGAYLEMGERDKARADVEEALRFLPDNARATLILKELGDE